MINARPIQPLRNCALAIPGLLCIMGRSQSVQRAAGQSVQGLLTDGIRAHLLKDAAEFPLHPYLFPEEKRRPDQVRDQQDSQAAEGETVPKAPPRSRTRKPCFPSGDGRALVRCRALALPYSRAVCRSRDRCPWNSSTLSSPSVEIRPRSTWAFWALSMGAPSRKMAVWALPRLRTLMVFRPPAPP